MMIDPRLLLALLNVNGHLADRPKPKSKAAKKCRRKAQQRRLGATLDNKT